MKEKEMIIEMVKNDVNEYRAESIKTDRHINHAKVLIEVLVKVYGMKSKELWDLFEK